mmetsp:Transcript_5620/g.5818  ORF Transcript_5620/g.5818 Transcript_5620/m.5818 type:complete len:195 (-) Transcript_5620:20-604(-)|eukprot:CAMPEP_0182420344 /NCGR_PEP_ID=MMETSP1167-20130531/5075_1 /TAXON_ID=2988 /ORGANISM="Mallomonas Sp, Strain CCMP3275" /LENGTH=194 /DNA_ID=CAMNT_0024596185 /DNA_START=230 /DNA_END=814 /DNA_ORIENTATION=-
MDSESKSTEEKTEGDVDEKEIKSEGKESEVKEGDSQSGPKWYQVADPGQPIEGERLHACVDGRYVTVFRNKNILSCIDSICHHAGGPFTLGKLQDIEELGGLTVVLCPWHKFMVSIDGGIKVYKGVDFKNGKPVPAGWKTGKIVQRPHLVDERPDGLYVSLVITDEEVSSDKDACSALCAKPFSLSNPQAAFIE